MTAEALQELLGEKISDADEETFLLFSRPFSSESLGFVDPKAVTLELSIAGRDYTIHQSPGMLSSNRKDGTTGAVVWKVALLFADWMASSENFLFQKGLLNQSSAILELGSGISGIVALNVAPRIQLFVASDQEYVLKGFNTNIHENAAQMSANRANPDKKGRRTQKRPRPINEKIHALALDWERDDVSSALASVRNNSVAATGLDAVIACDCIYNENLIGPFVQTCIDACRAGTSSTRQKPPICLIAQQLRSPEIFQAWLESFQTSFQVWRLPDKLLTEGLKEGSGFLVHLGILRDEPRK